MSVYVSVCLWGFVCGSVCLWLKVCLCLCSILCVCLYVCLIVVLTRKCVCVSESGYVCVLGWVENCEIDAWISATPMIFFVCDSWYIKQTMFNLFDKNRVLFRPKTHYLLKYQCQQNYLNISVHFIFTMVRPTMQKSKLGLNFWFCKCEEQVQVFPKHWYFDV